MQRYEDYYKILQVHYLAEPEIIESAYKRLAKKYHPDVNNNGNSVEMMQMINQAYEVLSNPEKRQEYNLEWKDKYNRTCESDCNHKKANRKSEKSLLIAKSVLDEYFRNIMNSNFDSCYEMISSIDKNNITKDDFKNWQNAVSKVYNLTDFSCRVYGIYGDKLLYGKLFNDVVEFEVNTVEYNTVMDMLEKDSFTKITVLEDGIWRVFVGYEKLQPLINKFNSLNSLHTAKSVINELVEIHSRVDSLTGLLNQRGIIERVNNEIHRFDRYGNVFSLIIVDIDISGMISLGGGHEISVSKKQAVEDLAVKLAGEMLLNGLRKLDVVGRWQAQAFLILLPETGWNSATKVIHKIQKMLKAKKVVHDGKMYEFVVKFGATEYESSIEESLDRINSFIDM